MRIPRIFVGLFLWLPVAAWAAQPAGEITLATGLSTSTARDGSVRNVTKGGRVYSGEFINTGPNSYLNIKFRDGGLMLLRPNTRFQIEQFEYEARPKPAEAPAPPTPAEAPKAEAAKPAGPKPEPAPVAEAPAEPESAPAEVPAQSEVSPALAPPEPSAAKTRPVRQKALFRLIKGGLRTVTGLIGKKDFADYQLRTPTATIGIRGTEYVTWTCDLACANDPVISAALKAVFGENFDPTRSEVIGTIKGTIEVTNSQTGETQQVKTSQYVLSTPTGDIPLPKEPEFIAKDRMPDPKACL